MDISRGQWLEERRKGIGGSDAAAILGLSRYASPYTVWEDKSGRAPEKEDTIAMRQGRHDEQLVAELFTEQTGLKVRRVNQTLYNPLYPHSLANIDRAVVKLKAGLECKTCSPYRIKEFDDGLFPMEYYVQCLHYMAVTGWDTWYLAVLIHGTEFKVFCIERDKVQLEIDELMKRERDFWEQFIIPDNKPPVDGLKATTEAIHRVYKTSIDNNIDLSEKEDIFIKLDLIRAQKKLLDADEELAKNEIKDAMGASTHAECGEWAATWMPRKDGKRVFTLKRKII